MYYVAYKRVLLLETKFLLSLNSKIQTENNVKKIFTN